MLKPKLTVLALSALLFLFPSPLSAQQKRPAAPRKPPAATKVAEPVLTFDTVLADDNYRLYSEVRNVGTLVRSEGFNSLLEPMVELASPPKQFATVLKWIKAHADPLAGSRMFAASWPSKKNLPAVLFAIEFASADEAKKFESALRRFLPKLDPKPAAAPSPPPGQPAVATAPSDASATNPGTFAQLQIKQTGALILLTDKPISFRDLKPPGSRLLAEDPNFALARNRFASDAIFVYADFKAIEKEEREQRQKWEEEEKRRQEQAAANPSPEPMIASDFEEEIIVSPQDDVQLPPAPESPELIQQTASADAAKQAAADQERIGSLNSLSLSLSMALLGGRAKWPEAVGAALAFEGDSYVVRALVLNTAENRALPLPFIPQIVSGPALTPGSPNILPGDVDLFIVLSLDYSQIYDGMIKTFSEQERFYQRAGLTTKPLSSPIASFEEKVGIKVKDDLLPLLGNEIAIVLPKPLTSGKAPTEAVRSANEANEDNDGRRSVRLPEAMPVIAISIKDKDAVKRLIPKMLEALGLKGANMLAHTEKREDAEIVSYANLFSYAFIGDFLLVTPSAAWTSRAIDSYLSGNTLSSNSRYKNATRWQSSQVQGQVYVSSDFVDSYAFVGKQKPPGVSLQSNQTIEPLTYSLANEGLGPLHEVHVPRSLLMMVVAGISSQADESPVYANESIAKSVLRTVVSAEATFKETKGNGHYGSIDELVAAGLLTKDFLEKYGYKIEVSVVSNKFEATAAPLEYGKTGRRSFYVDESGVLRGGDHAGGPATLSDKPINE